MESTLHKTATEPINGRISTRNSSTASGRFTWAPNMAFAGYDVIDGIVVVGDLVVLAEDEHLLRT